MEYSNFTFMESLLVDASKYAKSSENFCRNEDFKHCGADLRLFLEAIMRYLQQVEDISYNPGKNSEAIENLHRRGIINEDVKKWFHYVRQFANASVHSSNKSPSKNEALVALEYAFKIGRFLHNKERVNKFFGDFDARLVTKPEITNNFLESEPRITKKDNIVISDKSLVDAKLPRYLNSVGKEVFVQYFDLFQHYSAGDISAKEVIEILIKFKVSNNSGAAIRVSNVKKIFELNMEHKALDIILTSNRLSHDTITLAKKIRQEI